MDVQRTDISQAVAEPAAWGRLVTTSLAHMTEHLYVGVVTVLLPALATALGITMSQVGLLVSARTLAAGFSNIPSGLLADLANRRSVLLGGALIMLGLPALLMSFASGYWTVLILMVLLGIGSGSFHPQALAILSASYRERRATALGVHDSSGNLGEVIAPLTIGLILSFTDWRGALQIWAIPGLVVGTAYALFCPETENFTSARARFKRSLWEGVVANRAVLALFFISGFRSMGQIALVSFLPLYLSLELKLPAAQMGGYISLLFLFAGIAPSLVGWVSDRTGRRPLTIAGCALSALGVAALPYLAPGIALALGCAFVGVVLWALRPVIFAAAMEAAPPQLAGTLVGFIFTGNMGLSFLAPILCGIIADAYSLGAAVTLIGLFPLLAAVVALATRKQA